MLHTGSRPITSDLKQVQLNLSTTDTLGQKIVVVVGRWPMCRGLNNSQCMDCPPKNVAVVERWPLWRGGL